MSPELGKFIRRFYVEHPAGSVALKQFAMDFRACLPPEEAAAWNRGRLISELSAAGFALGTVSKVLHIAGILPRQAALRVVDGELVNV